MFDSLNKDFVILKSFRPGFCSIHRGSLSGTEWRDFGVLLYMHFPVDLALPKNILFAVLGAILGTVDFCYLFAHPKSQSRDYTTITLFID